MERKRQIKICGLCFNSGGGCYCRHLFTDFEHATNTNMLIYFTSIRVIYAILITLERPFEHILKYLFLYSELKSIFLLVLTFGGPKGVDFLFDFIAPIIDEKIAPRIRTLFLYIFIFVHGNVWRFCLPAMKYSHLEEMSDAITSYQSAVSQRDH